MIELINELRQIIDDLSEQVLEALADAESPDSLVARANDILNEITMEFNALEDDLDSVYRDMEDLESQNRYLEEQLEGLDEGW